MKITVLGAGSWGTTLAILLHLNKHEITLWEFDEDYTKILQKTHRNEIYLPGIHLPERIKITHQLLESVSDAELIVIAIPSQFVRSVIKQLKSFKFENVVFVNVSKGIETKTLFTVEQVMKDELSQLTDSQICVISGPSHAEEVARCIPTTVVAASNDENTAHKVQRIFNNSYFRVYSSTDLLGVEFGGSLKNIIAIGAGICDGAKFGDNTKAAIMTRGLAEISRFGVKLGANRETFFGLSGIGDLIVTCGSQHSRNRYVGEQLGQGQSLADILDSMSMVAEGVETCRSAYQLARKVEVETPIIDAIYSILFEGKDPIIATNELMTRCMKPEF